jgi:hypothetical protein
MVESTREVGDFHHRQGEQQVLLWIEVNRRPCSIRRQAKPDKNLMARRGENISKTIRKILDSWQEQMDDITIYITYEDILGNLQEDYETTLVA